MQVDVNRVAVYLNIAAAYMALQVCISGRSCSRERPLCCAGRQHPCRHPSQAATSSHTGPHPAPALSHCSELFSPLPLRMSLSSRPPPHPWQEYGSAIQHCSKALELEPRNPKALLRRLKARIAWHDYEGAQADLEVREGERRELGKQGTGWSAVG